MFEDGRAEELFRRICDLRQLWAGVADTDPESSSQIHVLSSAALATSQYHDIRRCRPRQDGNRDAERNRTLLGKPSRVKIAVVRTNAWSSHALR